MNKKTVIDDSVFQFENLTVYQKSLEFVDWTYLIIKTFPLEENYRLSSQFIRAAHSVVLNIAEGSAGTKQEFSYFLRISLRSVRECLVCAEIAFRQKYIDMSKLSETRLKAVEISKMLNGLIKSIKNKKN